MTSERDPGGLRSLGGRLALFGALLLLSGGLGVAYVSQRERDNAFCISCHGPAGSDRPLHYRLHTRVTVDARPLPDLAAAHYRAPDRIDCIDCHGGVGLLGRARVLLLSARDTLLYVTRRYEEPKGMDFAPLRDRDCTQCHSGFDTVAGEEGEAVRVPFHGHPEHQKLPMACVARHAAHVDGNPRLHFINDDVVVPQCRRCHEDFGKDGWEGGAGALPGG